MTVWEVRTQGARHPKVLACGRVDARTGRSACAGIVGYTKQSDGAWHVWLYASLTEDGSPGVWRTSRYAQRKRDDASRLIQNTGVRAHGRRVASGHPATVLPCTAPCTNGHVNRIDSGVLSD